MERLGARREARADGAIGVHELRSDATEHIAGPMRARDDRGEPVTDRARIADPLRGQRCAGRLGLHKDVVRSAAAALRDRRDREQTRDALDREREGRAELAAARARPDRHRNKRGAFTGRTVHAAIGRSMQLLDDGPSFVRERGASREGRIQQVHRVGHWRSPIHAGFVMRGW